MVRNQSLSKAKAVKDRSVMEPVYHCPCGTRVVGQDDWHEHLKRCNATREVVPGYAVFKEVWKKRLSR